MPESFPSFELTTMAPGQCAWCFEASHTLSETFQQPFEFWLPANGWSQTYLLPGEHEVPHEALDTACRSLCEAVSESQKTKTIPFAGGHLLGVPILADASLQAVAIRRFITDSPDLLLHLGAAFCRRWADRLAIERLQEENTLLVEQVSQAYEELVFIRHLTDYFQVASGASNLKMLADALLPMLHNVVPAERLLVLSAMNSCEEATSVLADLGETSPAVETIVRVVADCRATARNHPVVQNYVHQTSKASRYPGVRNYVVVPVSTTSCFFGWLVAFNTKPSTGPTEWHWQSSSQEFGTQEATLMATTAKILATHANNLGLLKEKEELLMDTVHTLVGAIEAKDHYTFGHSERVALYAQCIAVELGYTHDEAQRLYLTGLLHDVGKIGINDATLRKPGRLTDEEFAEIKSHPDNGWAILQGLKPLDYVLPGVLQHHERVDGTGYPDGLKAHEISLDGRILAVADAYDAMTSDRPYRNGMPSEKAEEILRDGAGAQWDDRVVEGFFAVLPKIQEIRTNYTPRQRVQRDRQRPNHGCQMSEVRDENGEVLAWS